MNENLVLLRHGQSTWNLENRFSGMVNPPGTWRTALPAGQMSI